MTPLNLSIVVPSFNEAESLPELTAWIKKVCEKNNFLYEIIIVDDGSTDNSWLVTEQLSNENECIKAIKFRRNYGKSAALNEGFTAAEGEVVITMDADLQDSPDEIPELYRMITEGGFDIVSGWKKKRYDPLSKTIPTKIYNAATRTMTGIKLHDMNCGLKAYKNEVVKNIEVYGEMHRYIPAIAKWRGFTKIGEKVVRHQERKYGVTKFGLERFINGFLDLLTIVFIGNFGRKPMHLFGTVGTLSFIIGGIIAIWLILEKQYLIYTGVPFNQIRDITAQPTFYLSLVAIVVGVQLFLAGFIGELVSRNAPNRNNYQVAKRLRLE